MKRVFRPFWQAANPSPSATWDLPVPLGPRAMMFWYLSMYSQRASSSTSGLLSDGIALKSKLIRCPAVVCLQTMRGEALCGWKLRGLDAPLDHPALALDQLKFTEPQQILDMILLLSSTLLRKFGILAQECWQAQLL